MGRTVQQSKVIDNIQEYKETDKINEIYIEGEELNIETINNTYKINIFKIPDNNVKSIINTEYLTINDLETLTMVESNIMSMWDENNDGFIVDIKEDEIGEYTCVDFQELGELKLNRVSKNGRVIIDEDFESVDDLERYIIRNKVYNKDGIIRTVGKNTLENNFKYNMDYITYRSSTKMDYLYSFFMVSTYIPQLIFMILLSITNKVTDYDTNPKQVPKFMTYLFIYMYSYVSYYTKNIRNERTVVNMKESVEDTINRTYKNMENL